MYGQRQQAARLDGALQRIRSLQRELREAHDSNAKLSADNGTLLERNRDLDTKWREASAAIRSMKASYEPRVLEV